MPPSGLEAPDNILNMTQALQHLAWPPRFSFIFIALLCTPPARRAPFLAGLFGGSTVSPRDAELPEESCLTLSTPASLAGAGT